jgi:hypothetical protein
MIIIKLTISLIKGGPAEKITIPMIKMENSKIKTEMVHLEVDLEAEMVDPEVDLEEDSEEEKKVPEVDLEAVMVDLEVDSEVEMVDLEVDHHLEETEEVIGLILNLIKIKKRLVDLVKLKE